MSAEHKRPLYAFAAVMVACVMIIAHAVHSQALTRFLGPSSPVIVAAGPHLIQALTPVGERAIPAAEPELPRVEDAAVPAPRAVIRRSSERSHRGRGAARASTVSPATKPGKASSPGKSRSAGNPSSPGKSRSAGKPSSPGKSASAPGHAHSAAATGTPPGKARAAGAPGRSAGHGRSRGAAPGRGATKERSRTASPRGQGAKRPTRAVKGGPSARGQRSSRR